jgi:hypothetical protein
VPGFVRGVLRPAIAHNSISVHNIYTMLRHGTACAWKNTPAN